MFFVFLTFYILSTKLTVTISSDKCPTSEFISFGNFEVGRSLQDGAQKRYLIKRGTYFKLRRVTHVKLQNFVIVFFQIAISNYHYDI